MQTNILFFNCNVLALFTFYAVPSSGKYKCALVHQGLITNKFDIFSGQSYEGSKILNYDSLTGK